MLDDGPAPVARKLRMAEKNVRQYARGLQQTRVASDALDGSRISGSVDQAPTFPRRK